MDTKVSRVLTVRNKPNPIKQRDFKELYFYIEKFI